MGKPKCDEQGIMIALMRNGKESNKLIGPFRNSKSVRNWLAGNAYAAEVFEVRHPNGQVVQVQGAEP